MFARDPFVRRRFLSGRPAPIAHAFVERGAIEVIAGDAKQARCPFRIVRARLVEQPHRAIDEVDAGPHIHAVHGEVRKKSGIT